MSKFYCYVLPNVTQRDSVDTGSSGFVWTAEWSLAGTCDMVVAITDPLSICTLDGTPRRFILELLPESNHVVQVQVDLRFGRFIPSFAW